MIIKYLGKEVQNKPADDKDVNIVDRDSAFYSIDGGVQLSKNMITKDFGKEVQSKNAGDKNINIVDKDSTSYSLDGEVKLNKNCKYCHFYFLSLK